MRKAKVIVTDIGARGNKIFHSGDIVTENNFPEGNFDKLIVGGYIKEEIEPVAEVVKLPKTIKKVLTKKDLKDNPDLVEAGLKIGDEIEIPNPDYVE